MKNNRSLYYRNYNRWGQTVRVKLLVQNCPIVSIKHLHLEGHSKASLVKFEGAEDIINSISADRGQYPDYLQSIYNYIQKLLKTSIII